MEDKINIENHLNSSIEFRKRKFLASIIHQQLKQIGFIDYNARDFIHHLLVYLGRPNNFYDLDTILSWFDIFLLDEFEDTQIIITDFIEHCLALYQQKSGTSKVITS